MLWVQCVKNVRVNYLNIISGLKFLLYLGYIEEEDLSQELIENTAEETETLESSEEKDVITRESQYFEENTANYLAQNLGTTQNEVYNPNQDKEEVLEIRRTYAQLREELSRCGRELVQADSNKLSELIDQANVIFSKGKNYFAVQLMFFNLLLFSPYYIGCIP